jgi:hypothetical protein
MHIGRIPVENTCRYLGGAKKGVRKRIQSRRKNDEIKLHNTVGTCQSGERRGQENGGNVIEKEKTEIRGVRR